MTRDDNDLRQCVRRNQTFLSGLCLVIQYIHEASHCQLFSEEGHLQNLINSEWDPLEGYLP